MFQHFFKGLASMSSKPEIFLCLSSAILLFWLVCFKNSKFKSFSAFVAKRSASTRSTLISLANLSRFSFTALISAMTIFRLNDFCVSSFSALCSLVRIDCGNELPLHSELSCLELKLLRGSVLNISCGLQSF